MIDSTEGRRTTSSRHRNAAILLGAAAAALLSLKIIGAQVTGPVPVVVTGAAFDITQTSAFFRGTVYSNDGGAMAWFDYGTTTGYGRMTPAFPSASGATFIRGTFGLTCNTLYHFRAAATDSNGTGVGGDATFTTSPCPPPTVTTTFPTGFSATSVTLNGTVNPNGQPTTARFQYGMTTAYGSVTPSLSVGAGTSDVVIPGGALSGLSCNTVYHFRAIAQSPAGTATGSDQVFSPPCAATLDSGLLTVVNDHTSLRVFNASTLVLVAAIPVPWGTPYDVVINPSQSRAYASRDSGIYIVDLTTSPPSLASGINPIPAPAGMLLVEDLALTRNGRFLVATADVNTAPIAVIDTATHLVKSTLNVLGNHTSVEVCDSGSVLVTNDHMSPNVIRRLTISSAGALTDTGQQIAIAGKTWNSAVCAVGGTMGVAVSYTTSELQSFLINGMTPIATQPLPGNGSALNLAISPDGTRVFGRRYLDMLTAYSFNPSTGAFGSQLWSTNVGSMAGFYGVDQVAVDPSGRRVFATALKPGVVLSLNASTGAIDGGAAAPFPVGIALKRRTSLAEGDYDGDGRDDVAVFRPSTGTWYVKDSGGSFLTQAFGLATDIPVRGDYDGDGQADPAVFRPSTGTWYILKSSTNYTTFISQTWGLGTDMPVPGDYDGDGKSDFAVFRPSTGTWYVLLSGANYTTFIVQAYGMSADVPVPGDYDGDGKTDLALFRPSNGTWFVLLSGGNYTTSIMQAWGVGTDVPVPGDYDGDGKTDPAVFRPSTGTWYLLQSSTNFATYRAQQWGLGTDTTVQADYDGDGKTDLGVYRSSTGVWYILTSASNYTTYLMSSWGLSTDVALLGPN